jgi:hypothetical protein
MSVSSDLLGDCQCQREPETFLDELYRVRNRLHRYNLRFHLARFPKDLLAQWWRKDGMLPRATSRVAYQNYKAGAAPGKLYRGPLARPQLRIIDGDKKGARILQR